MRISRIYQQAVLVVGECITLTREASHYVCQVLRHKEKDQVIVFNGQGGEYLGVIEQTHRHKCSVRLHEFYDKQVESRCKIHLLQAISRGARMDYAIQKAVELGVTEITPVITKYTHVNLNQDRQGKRLAHWQAVAVSAAEQSGRCLVPTLNPLQRFDLATQLHCDCGIMFEPQATSSLSDLPVALSSVNVMIGPEGGFSSDELRLAQQASYVAYRLGPRTLRTETATVVALTLLQARWGDLLG